MPGNAVKAVTLASFDTATITVAYKALDPNGLDQACFMIELINQSNIAVTVSFNGVRDSTIIFANSVRQFPVQENKQPRGNLALWPKGQIVYVAAAAPGVGHISLAGYYVQP